MNEENDLREYLIDETKDILDTASNNLELGSEEYSRACSCAKTLLDAKSRHDEYELKILQLKQEKQIADDTRKLKKIEIGTNIAELAAGIVALFVGYHYNYKANGYELGSDFKTLKGNLTRKFFRHH